MAIEVRAASLIAALMLSLGASRAAADGSWLVVSVSADVSATAAVERAVRARGLDVIDPAAALERFERVHSHRAIAPTPGQLDRLDQLLRQVSDQLAAEDLTGLATSFEEIARSSSDVLDSFDRDVRRARLRFHHCLAAAELFDRRQQPMAAQEQLSACARDFPGLDPELGAGTDARLQAFLARTRASFAASAATRLSIAIEPTSAAIRCAARVDGIDRGNAPLTIDKLHTARVRVELDCGATPGRVYDVAVADESQLRIDPSLDRALDTTHRLELDYADAASAEAARVRHGLVLAKAIGAAGVLEVERTRLHRIDVATGRELDSAAISGEGSIERALTALFAERTPGGLVRSSTLLPPSAAEGPAIAPINPTALAPSRPFRTLGYVTSGIAVAGAATAIMAWRVRAGHVARFNRSADCTQADPGSLLAGCVRELDGASAARTILSVGAIAAGAGLLIAGTWFVLDANRSRPDRNAELACGGGPGDLGIACGLQF